LYSGATTPYPTKTSSASDSETLSTTRFVPATKSSFHFRLTCCDPFLKTSGAGEAVMPTSGTFWRYVPSGFPGFSPIFLK
jgi:hypothetical protein